MQMWEGLRRCEVGDRFSPAQMREELSLVPVQMCEGVGRFSPSDDVGGMSPVPVLLWDG